jgi:hypothetical protein
MQPDDTLQAKLLKHFPDPEKRSAAEAELRRYGTVSYENELSRARLAVLKISGGDPEWTCLTARPVRCCLREAFAP